MDETNEIYVSTKFSESRGEMFVNFVHKCFPQQHPAGILRRLLLLTVTAFEFDE